MPRKGNRRRKRRTHVDEDSEEPITLVTRRGKIGTLLKHLVTEIKTLIYPNSPLKFKESSKTSLKDIIGIANYYTVNHLILVTCTEKASYIKFTQLKHGPTLTFRINSFTLNNDIKSYQKRYANLQPQFKSGPILIMKGVTGVPEMVFKSIFPPVDMEEFNIQRCKRVLLILHEDGVYQLRHYLIKKRDAGISKTLTKLARSEVPNLNKYQDIREWIQHANTASDSEGEDIQVPSSNSKVSLRLVEIGPRLTMTLRKIEEGMFGGAVIYHELVHRTESEVRLLEKRQRNKRKTKEKRKKIQEENVARKIEEKEMRRKKRKVSEGEQIELQMDIVLEFLKTTQGRDKMLKLVQYLTRLIRNYSNSYDVLLALDKLHDVALDSRRTFRFFRTVFELEKIMKLIQQPIGLKFDFALKLGIYIMYSAYWALDNILLLAQCHLFRLPSSQFALVSNSTRFIGLLFTIIYLIRSILNSFTEEAMVKEKSMGILTQIEVIEKLDEFKDKRSEAILNTIKSFADLIQVSNRLDLPLRVLGKRFTVKWVGIGGIISSVISIYQVQRKLNPL